MESEILKLKDEQLFESAYLIGLELDTLTRLHLTEIERLLNFLKLATWSDVHIAFFTFNKTTCNMLVLTRDFKRFLVSQFLYRRNLRQRHLGLEAQAIHNLTKLLT